MRIEYEEVSLKKVLDYFSKDFKPKPRGNLIVSDAFVDTAKEVVIFKLYIDDPPDNSPG